MCIGYCHGLIVMDSPAEVEYVQWGILGEDDHRANAFGQVRTYELNTTGQVPAPNGPASLLFGTTDHSFRCKSCNNNRKDCVGHPGVYELSIPVPQPAFISEIRNWARVVCLECGALMVDAKDFAGVPSGSRLGE